MVFWRVRPVALKPLPTNTRKLPMNLAGTVAAASRAIDRLFETREKLPAPIIMEETRRRKKPAAVLLLMSDSSSADKR